MENQQEKFQMQEIGIVSPEWSGQDSILAEFQLHNNWTSLILALSDWAG
jgi:hypothetical protein